MNAPRTSSTLATLVALLVAIASSAIAPHDTLASADESCLARVKKEAWNDRPMTVVLDDGRRLELDRWSIRTKSPASITVKEWFAEKPTMVVPADSIHRIEYSQRGTAWGGRIGAALAMTTVLVLTSDRKDQVSSFEEMGAEMEKGFGSLLLAVAAGLAGAAIGNSIFPPKAIPRIVECPVSAPRSATPSSAHDLAADPAPEGETHP